MYVLFEEDNVTVKEVRPYAQEGFVEVEGNPIPEQIWDGEKFINPPPPPKTPQEIRSEKKLEGVEFNGVMCSATVTDQLGLLATKAWVEVGGSTTFEFENGNKLLLSPENFAAFAAVWMPFRASFFDDE